MHLSVAAALRKRHEKAQCLCRRVRKVAIRIRMTFVLKTVHVSYRLRVICHIPFPYTTANWTLLCVSFSHLARPLLTTSRDMPRIYFWVHLSIHFRPVTCQIPNLKFWASPLLYGDHGSTLVKVLCYKSEGRWFDPSLCQWIFHWHKKPSDRTMALGSTLTEMSTKSNSWG